jgi:hypothetical protein
MFHTVVQYFSVIGQTVSAHKIICLCKLSEPRGGLFLAHGAWFLLPFTQFHKKMPRKVSYKFSYISVLKYLTWSEYDMNRKLCSSKNLS